MPSHYVCSACGQLSKAPRCPHHAKRQPDRRANSARRGYGSKWRAVRDLFLRRNPICADCGEVATEAHHVVKVRDDRSQVFKSSNLLPLCKRCHSVRTARGE